MLHTVCQRGQGGGASGQLGQMGSVEDLLTPTQIPTEEFGGCKVCCVSCGADTTAAVTVEGSLYTWGQGSHGRLGLGHQRCVTSPGKVRSEKRVGRFRRMAADKLLAFAMVSHPRLGAASVWLELLPELVERIGLACSARPPYWAAGSTSSRAVLPVMRALLGDGVPV